MIRKTLGIFGICSLFSTAIYGENAQLQKQVVFVKLSQNSKMAHAQFALFQNMDVVGVNRKTHEAELYVTSDELKQLKAANLSVYSKISAKTEEELNTALNNYMNPQKVRDELAALGQKFPTLTNVFEIGKTTKNIPIMAVEISSHIGDTSRPVVMFNAMHHAREVMTTEVVMHMANVLTEGYGDDAEITNWLDSYRIVIVPQVNPDGNNLVHSGQTMWRKNAYTVNNVTKGVDLNRNYPAYWNYCAGSSGSTSSETFRGPSPASEPETQAIMNLVSNFKPVAGISYHSYSELIIYPYGCSNVPNPSKDLFRKIALNMKAAIRDDNNQLNTYDVGTAPELLYNTDGADDDWMWKEKGVIAFTIEVNAADFQPDYNKWRNVTAQRQEGGWKTLLRQMQSSGFHGFVQTQSPHEVTYSVTQLLAENDIALNADDTAKKFALKSEQGLMYQLTEPGNYQISFYRNGVLLKNMDVQVENENINLGTIEL